ncbi:MAG: glycosyltransferase, partial [Rhodospirillaceae bacterium]|nr:glycosyltransferase [Rhodospirillales bacterium]
MIRLLQAMAGADRGGAEGFFERLTLALERAGIHQHVLIRHNPRRHHLLHEGGVAVTELPFGGMLDVKTRRGFSKAVHEFKPAIVLTWMNRASRFCPKGHFIRVGRLGGYYDLKYYRGFDHLIGNTQDICDWIIGQGWRPEQVHYVPNFVSAAVAPPVSRATFSTPEGVPVLLALGRLHENKAFDILIKALPTIPEAYLWLAGEGPLRAELELLASRLGVISRVRFLGWRDDVAGLFAAADIFVCPSRHEPLGNVVIEAWAQGIPVVATASEGPGELIEDDIDGVLVPVDNPAALSAGINRVLADPNMAAHMGAAGRQVYQERFTEAVVVARYLEFFRKVAG